MNWVSVALTQPEWMEDLDGVSWHEAPLPRRWHRCRAQTRGFIFNSYIERCACGATWLLDGRWIEKNSRRHQ